MRPFAVGNTATVIGCFRLQAILKELRMWGESDTFDEEEGEIRGYWEMVKDIVSLSLKQPLSSVHEQTVSEPPPPPDPQPTIQPRPSNSGPISDPQLARQQSSNPSPNNPQPAIQPSNCSPNNPPSTIQQSNSDPIRESRPKRKCVETGTILIPSDKPAIDVVGEKRPDEAARPRKGGSLKWKHVESGDHAIDDGRETRSNIAGRPPKASSSKRKRVETGGPVINDGGETRPNKTARKDSSLKPIASGRRVTRSMARKEGL